jgi:hypothetical protein
VQKYTARELRNFQRRLDSVMCPVDLAPRHTAGPGRLIIELGIREAIQTARGGITFIIEVALQNDLPSPIRLAYPNLDIPPWQDDEVTWLEDPALSPKPSRVYRFHDGSADYPREVVVNHRFAEINQGSSRGEELKPGDHLEGYLLGESGPVLPAEAPVRSIVHGSLVIVDTAGREFKQAIACPLDRSPWIAAQPAIEKRRRLRRSLFEREGVPSLNEGKCEEAATTTTNEGQGQAAWNKRVASPGRPKGRAGEAWKT